MDSGVGGSGGLNIGGAGGGEGGFHKGYVGMHKEDSDREALLLLKEALG